MAIVIDEYTLYGTILVVAILGKIVTSQGGLKIVLWRVQGTKWFLFTLIQKDGNTVRMPFKASRIHHSQLPRFDTKYGTFFTGGPDETARIFGGPQWVYTEDDARPVKLSPKADGERFSPTIIADAFHDETVSKFNMLKQPIGSRFKWGLFGIVIALVFVMSIVSVFYTYYFGVNLNCALHTKVCP